MARQYEGQPPVKSAHWRIVHYRPYYEDYLQQACNDEAFRESLRKESEALKDSRYLFDRRVSSKIEELLLNVAWCIVERMKL